MDTFVIVLVVILVLIYLGQKAFFNESFENTNQNVSNDKIKLYVFVSSHCPHCHTYLDKEHKNVSEVANSKNIDIKLVRSDGSAESNELFEKYDVQFIPAAIIVKGDKVHKNLGSNITPQSVKSALEN